MAKEVQKAMKTAGQDEGKIETIQEQAAKKEQKAPQESIYACNELAANAKKVFRTRPECVTAALRAAGKEKYTVAEAKQIVEKFLKREVR